jgi:hypothetical protein
MVHSRFVRDQRRAIFFPARWRTLTGISFKTAPDAQHPSLARDRLHRRAWTLSLASRPDAWSLSAFLFSIMCLDQCRKFWSSPATEGRA